MLTVTRRSNNAASTLTTTFNYNTDGMHSQSAAQEQPLTATDLLGHVTHFRYDNRRNPTLIAYALGIEIAHRL